MAGLEDLLGLGLGRRAARLGTDLGRRTGKYINNGGLKEVEAPVQYLEARDERGRQLPAQPGAADIQPDGTDALDSPSSYQWARDTGALAGGGMGTIRALDEARERANAPDGASAATRVAPAAATPPPPARRGRVELGMAAPTPTARPFQALGGATSSDEESRPVPEEIRAYLAQKSGGDGEMALTPETRAGVGRLLEAGSEAGARIANVIATQGRGPKFDPGEFAARRAAADQPLRDEDRARAGRMQDAQLAMEQAKASRETAANDPASPVSRALQATLAKMPGFQGRDLSGIPAARFPEISKMLELQMERDSKERISKDSLDARRQDSAERSKDRAARLAETRMMFGAKQEERESDRLDKQAAKLGEDYAKSGLPEANSALGVVESILQDPKNKDDLPGKGFLAGRLPDWAVSGDGQRLRMAAGQLLAQYQKGITGSGMSDAERRNFGKITGMLDSADEGQFRQGVELLSGSLQARQQALTGAVSPEAVARYSERNPDFARAPGAPAQSPDAVPMLDPQGRRRMVPRARVKDALAAGGRMAE